jgi:hypothetical protein
VKVRYEYLDGSNRTKSDGEIFLSQRTQSKHIHKELVITFQDNAISLSAVKNWLRRFKSGDLSYGNEERPGRPLISLARLFSTF